MTRAVAATAGAALLFAAIALAVQAATGILGPADPAFGAARLGPAALALLLPALCEEVVFRGPLLRRPTPAAMALSLATYLAWHPLAAMVFRPGLLPLFTDPAFLGLTALLGALATALTVGLKSLAPAVALHWIAVAGWIVLWGPPRG